MNVNDYVRFRPDGDTLRVTVHPHKREYVIYNINLEEDWSTADRPPRYCLKLYMAPIPTPRWSKPKRRKRTALGLRRPTPPTIPMPMKEPHDGWKTVGYMMNSHPFLIRPGSGQ